jgi:dihydropteroate synthase
MLVMGILNATPDSFADGGEHFTYPDAVDHGLKLIVEGADIIDVGGESTRPGAERVSPAEEERRVINVISKLVDAGKPISIDTMRASTARAAVIAGASIINDVSGGLADAAMLDTAAELKVPYIAMHWRGHSKEMNNLAVYTNVVDDVIAELNLRVEAALSAGVSKSNLIIDPGIGFAKEPADNWLIIEEIQRFVALGYPVLVGASRKRFLGGDDPTAREAATVELTKRLSQSGIWAVRVHGVAANKAVLQ